MKRPSFLKKKEILFSAKTPREDLIIWGDRFLEEMRLHDALAFYRQAGHLEGVARIRETAIQKGDFFLFREAQDGLDPGNAAREELGLLAKNAEAAGRWHDARKAFEQLRDPKGIRRAQEGLQALMGAAVGQEAGGG